MDHDRRQSPIRLLFKLVLALEQTEQNQTNLPKITHAQKMSSEATKHKILFQKRLDTRWKFVPQVEINIFKSPN